MLLEVVVQKALCYMDETLNFRMLLFFVCVHKFRYRNDRASAPTMLHEH